MGTSLVDSLLSRARRAKHSAYVTGKRVRARHEPLVAPALDAVLRTGSRWFPPPTIEPGGRVSPGPAPRQMFCLWTGDNPMSENRLRALDSIRRWNSEDFDVVLVTQANLADWIVDGHPLHPAYQDLALIHRADYLRTYLMHHHGGAYTDVKEARQSWGPALESLNADPEAWLLGYHEVSYRWVAPARGRLRRSMAFHHHRLLGNGAYVVKPGSPFTSQWLDECESRLDRLQDALQRCPGTVYGDNAGYPVPFYGLLGEIFHPLCLRHHDRLRYDDRITPKLADYK